MSTHSIDLTDEDYEYTPMRRTRSMSNNKPTMGDAIALSRKKRPRTPRTASPYFNPITGCQLSQLLQSDHNEYCNAYMERMAKDAERAAAIKAKEHEEAMNAKKLLAKRVSKSEKDAAAKKLRSRSSDSKKTLVVRELYRGGIKETVRVFINPENLGDPSLAGDSHRMKPMPSVTIQRTIELMPLSDIPPKKRFKNYCS